MNNKPRFTAAELSDAMFHDATTKTTIRYEMRNLIDKHPDVVEMLAEAKDDKNQYLFKARDINWILYNCQNEVANNPEKLKQVLDDREKVKLIALYPIRYEGFMGALHDSPKAMESFAEITQWRIKNGMGR